MLVATPPGCTTDSFTGLFAIASSCRRLSEKPRTANFAAQYAVWPGGAMMPKIEERLTICASRCFDRCGRNARVPCTTPQKLMLISHSICAWSTSLKAPSSATPALLMTMLSEGWAAMAACANSLDLRGLADIDAMRRDLARACLADLGGHLLQARPRRGRRAPGRSRARPAPAPARGRCRWRRRSRRPRFRISQSFAFNSRQAERSAGKRAGKRAGKEQGNLIQPARFGNRRVRALAPTAARPAVIWRSNRTETPHDALVPADLADRGRLPRHRRALYAGGGADQGAAERCGRLRLHARDRAAYAGRHARAWPRCCTPARWRSPR